MAEVDEQQLTEEEILEAGPVIEAQAQLLVPKKGKLFEEDGTCKIAVIRPCVSLGKRLRGHPPIYTHAMLAENAAVFTDWHMFMDHLTEEMVEALRKRERSIRELGGRIVKSWWDPDLTTKEDDERGFRPGGVVAKALPQPPVRAMLEADPLILRTSINAWPKSAKLGSAPWNPSLKGMVVEGIRSRPRGSVDWVLRDGAGGRVLAEDAQLAVSLLESYYDAAAVAEVDFSKLDRKGLVERLRESAPNLLKELKLEEGEPEGTPPARPEPTRESAAGGLSREDVEALLEKQRKDLQADFETKLEEAGLSDEDVEERVQEKLEERDTSRDLEKAAHKLIEAARLPAGWERDLKRRYSVRPSGPSEALQLTEGEDKDGNKLTIAQVLEGNVEADLKHARDLIEESGGTPRVRGLGRSTPDPQGEGARRVTETRRRERTPAWLEDFGPLGESEKDAKAEDRRKAEDDAIAEMVSEGVTL